ncbi:MAG: aminotransferase class I/II-fold pyridoxal phosphate-dependent enzyme [Polyangiaceae bacterium]|nr:aminotransferase class I/II-fold pyridoxal phosphate-dependent enzyme [Polyangiaceae bacterium]
MASERIYLSPPHVGPLERELLLDAFDSNWLAPLGPHVDGFEAELAAAAGVGHAATLSSGTAALHLALLLLGVGRGDEVWTSSFTFVATANAISYVGAVPVFIDSDSATWNLDPDLLAEELRAAAAKGKLPKAVLVVDLYGQCADYDRILSVCDEFEIPVIEDAAEALGATYRGRPAGGLARFGVFSFNGNKIITTSGGGALVANDETAIARARFLSSQARENVAHYEHEESGFNYRLSNLLAAVGRGQLRQLSDRVAARRRIFEQYRQGFLDKSGIAMMPEADYGVSNRWLTVINVDEQIFGASAGDIRLTLATEEIEARPVWKPMHLQPVFSEARAIGGKVSEGLFATGLCLPSGSALTENAVARVIQAVLSAAVQRGGHR